MKKRIEEIEGKSNIPNRVNIWFRVYGTTGRKRTRKCLRSTLKTIDGLVITLSRFTHGGFIGDPKDGDWVIKEEGYECIIKTVSGTTVLSRGSSNGDYLNTIDIDESEKLALKLNETIK